MQSNTKTEYFKRKKRKGGGGGWRSDRIGRKDREVQRSRGMMERERENDE